jgi:hypothetical protein
MKFDLYPAQISPVPVQDTKNYFRPAVSKLNPSKRVEFSHLVVQKERPGQIGSPVILRWSCQQARQRETVIACAVALLRTRKAELRSLIGKLVRQLFFELPTDDSVANRFIQNFGL